MRKLALYIRLTADRLGLKDHEVSLDATPTGEGRIAECDLTPFRQSVCIRVCADFFLLTPEKQRHAIVHELTHAHFEAVCSTVAEAVPPWMPPKTWEMFNGVFERDLEVVVDTVAVLLCPLIELPKLD